MPILLVLICAATGIPLLALWGDGRRGAALFIGINMLTLLAILALAVRVLRDGAFTAGNGQFMVDDLSILLILVDGVVGLSTAWFSRSYMRQEIVHWSLSRRRVRLYHAMFQAFLTTMLLALLQIDTKISLGQILAAAVGLFGAGGAWYALKLGQANTDRKIDEAQKTTTSRLDQLSRDIDSVKTEYLRKDLSEANEKLLAQRVEALERERWQETEGKPKRRT